mmetsp:Transcript_28826/g.84495  ORF Transcript_28826/g.84495 Transcript_28826/m.84495 type:complete len:268 (-) Transcript_28826:148-951(-)
MIVAPLARSLLHRLRFGLDDPAIALGLELERERCVPRLHDLAVAHDVHVVRLDVVEEPLVVRDHDDSVIRPTVLVDTLRYFLQGVDVQPRVKLVEDGHGGLEKHHLQDLVALLLAAREALIDVAVEEVSLHGNRLKLLRDEGEELEGAHLLLARSEALFVKSHAEEVCVRDPWNLDGVLEGHEHALLGALLRVQREEVLALVGCRPTGHLVGVVPDESFRQRRLPGAVGSHDGVHLALAHAEVDALKNRNVVHRSAQALHIQDDFTR